MENFRGLPTPAAMREFLAEQKAVNAKKYLDRPRHTIQVDADLAMDAVNLKISKLGGLTRTRQLRDLCVSLGIGMTLEDSWGGDIATAAIAHLAQSTPPEFLFTTTDFNSYVTVSTAEGAPQRLNDHAPPPSRQ